MRPVHDVVDVAECQTCCYERLQWSYRPLAGASRPDPSSASAVKDTLRPEGQARGGGGSGAIVGPSGEAAVAATATVVPAASMENLSAGVSARGADEVQAPIEAHEPGANGEQHPLSVPLKSPPPDGISGEPNMSTAVGAAVAAPVVAWCIPAGMAPTGAGATFASPPVPQGAPPLANESCRSSALESTAVMRRRMGSECTMMITLDLRGSQVDM